MMMRVLIVHGSRMGATADLAEQLASSLADKGIRADVRPADAAPAPDGYDAVIVGGALYAGHWMVAARRYVRDNAAALRRVPVWLFSSGPLDDSAERTEIAPVREVAQLAWSIAARGHQTFGGKLDRATARGPIARLMARRWSGDWRDQQHVATWAGSIADVLLAEQNTHRPAHPSLSPHGRPSPTGSASAGG